MLLAEKEEKGKNGGQRSSAEMSLCADDGSLLACLRALLCGSKSKASDVSRTGLMSGERRRLAYVIRAAHDCPKNRRSVPHT